MTKRRWLSLLMAAVMLLTLAACGGSAPSDSSAADSGESSSAPAVPEKVTGILDDEAFLNPDVQYKMLKIANSLSNMYPESSFNGYCDSLKTYGFGGIVGNVGYTKYLESDKMWTIFEEQMEWMTNNDMRIWIYDEHGYPSGGAKTLVLDKNPEYEALGMARIQQAVSGGETVEFTAIPASHTPYLAVAYPGTSDQDKDLEGAVAIDSAIRDDNTLMWTAPEGDWLVEYFLLKPLYEETHASGNVWSDRRYINIMDFDAVASFIDFTHEAYYEHVGEYFDGTVEAFFTDEPSLMSFSAPDYEGTKAEHPQADDFVRYPTAPWSRDFEEQFLTRRGYDIAPYLTCVFGGDNEEFARIRYDFQLTVAELVEEAYFGQIGDWCEEHGVDSSGHLLAEENIYTQMMTGGNFMKNYAHQGVVGIDLLTSDPDDLFYHALTIKLAASANRLYNKNGVMSEDSTFSDKDATGVLEVTVDDVRSGMAVQYALGVDQVTSYYAFNEIAEDGCTEEERALTGNMVARMGYALDEGEHVSNVVLYFPIESAYVDMLPNIADWGNDLSDRMVAVQDVFSTSLRTLVDQQLDTDVLDVDAILESTIEGNTLVSPGGEKFRVVVMPKVTMISEKLIDKLLECADAGIGVVTVADSTGFYTLPGEDTASAAKKWEALAAHENHRHADTVMTLASAVRELLPDADVSFAKPGQVLCNHMTREDGDVYLLANYTGSAVNTEATFRATGTMRLLDPLTGEIKAIQAIASDDETTTIQLELPSYGYTILEFTK